MKNNELNSSLNGSTESATQEQRVWIKPTFESVSLNKALSANKNLAVNDGTGYGS